MSQGKVLEKLFNLGFTKLEAKVYVFLAKRGPQKASDIVCRLKIRKQTLYLILKKLENKGIVSVSLEYPARFSALPIEQIVNLLINAKMEETRILEEKKTELLLDWKDFSIEKNVDNDPKFMVIEGRRYIYSRMQQMAKEANEELSFLTTVSGLTRAYQSGVLDTAKSNKKPINFRFLTELTKNDADLLKALLRKNSGKELVFNGRIPDLEQRLPNQVLIKDKDEAMFFIASNNPPKLNAHEGAWLWTNSKNLVLAFSSLFEELWEKSSDVRKKITELETGQLTPKTYVIKDPEVAKKDYFEKIAAASEEIILLTSAEDLVHSSSWIHNVKSGSSLPIKIMAPITNDNLDIALHLSKCCDVRHVPISYLKTTIVDGQHFYQFKNPSTNQENAELVQSFKNTFYTNDVEYVNHAKKMLDDLWINARAPFAITLEELTKPRVPPVAPISENEYAMSKQDSSYKKLVVTLKEEPELVRPDQILDRIINAKRIRVKDPSRDIVRLYGSMASAVIRTPNTLSLPDMVLVFYHCNKQSSFGADDWFQVYLRLQTSKGEIFVPVAVVGDNPQSVQWRKHNYYTGTPAAQNCLLLRKDEIKIQVHGNTFFAAWTKSIPLVPNKYVLPPAGLLLEGYSRLKTTVTKTAMPSGVKLVIEGNGFDAFVTLFHPTTHYAGPGTDGIIGRDMILTTYPPI